jgi:hypothetical protein
MMCAFCSITTNQAASRIKPQTWQDHAAGTAQAPAWSLKLVSVEKLRSTLSTFDQNTEIAVKPNCER